MNIIYYGNSDPGRCRERNEDSFGLFSDLNLFMVADGMGGRSAGDVASKLVVEVLPLLIRQRIPGPESLRTSEVIQRIKDILIDLSNRILHESSRQSAFEGMGTTLVMALLTKQHRFIAHMGDSRAYLFREGVLQQITNDHNLLRHLLLSGDVTQDETSHHPGQDQLLQYIGMEGEPDPTVICIPRMPNEYLCLCSDGLTKMLSHQIMTRLLLNNLPSETAHLTSEDLKKSTGKLIEAANQAGGEDNITVVMTD